MVSFDAADAGTARAEWDQDPRIDRLPPLTLPESPLVVLAAHPDDETLGAGGLVAAAVRRGLDVTVVVVTDGGEEAAARRAGEVAEAARILGVVRPPVLLGFPDGAIREVRHEVKAALTRLLDGIPSTPLLVSTWVGDGHRDHRVLGEVAAELAHRRGLELWQYPIWMWHWGDPGHSEVPWQRLGAVALTEADLEAKREALGAFPSQTTPSDDRPPMLQPRFLEHFDRSFEVVVLPKSA